VKCKCPNSYSVPCLCWTLGVCSTVLCARCVRAARRSIRLYASVFRSKIDFSQDFFNRYIPVFFNATSHFLSMHQVSATYYCCLQAAARYSRAGSSCKQLYIASGIHYIPPLNDIGTFIHKFVPQNRERTDRISSRARPPPYGPPARTPAAGSGGCGRGNGSLFPFQQLKPQNKDVNRTSPSFHKNHGRKQHQQMRQVRGWHTACVPCQ
jgi:hypothetical protein